MIVRDAIRWLRRWQAFYLSKRHRTVFRKYVVAPRYGTAAVRRKLLGELAADRGTSLYG